MTEKAASAAAAKPAVDGLRLDARYAGRTVLAVGAHPDDLELGIGGTIAKLAKRARVVMVVVAVPNLLEVRLAEAARSAAILGGELNVLVPGACRRVEDLKTYELVEMLDALAKRYEPSLMLTHGACDFHMDHTLVFNASLATQRLRSFDLLSYPPTATRPTTAAFDGRIFVDVSDCIDVKMDAIAAHESQFAARGLAIDMYREQSREYGLAVGVEYAETLALERLVFC